MTYCRSGSLSDLRAIWHIGIRCQQNNVVVGQHGAENEDVRSEARDAARGKVDDSHHLAPIQCFWPVSGGDLCAALFRSDLPEVDVQLQGGTSRGRMYPRGYHSAHADVEVLELIEGWHV